MIRSLLVVDDQSPRLSIATFNEQQQAVYDVSNIAASENKMAVHLPQHPQRKISSQIDSRSRKRCHRLQQCVFHDRKREQPKETMGKWITRLDDPIKKNSFIFQKRK